MSNTEQNVGVKGLAVICLILLSIVLGMNSPVSAVNSPDITWKDSSASAVSGKCLQQGLVRSGAVCLPGKAEGTLNWQPKPVQGKSCIRSGVSYKSLTCNKVGNRLKWVIQTTDESASEIASNFAAAMSKITDNLLVTGMKVAKQKLDALWFKNKALGLIVNCRQKQHVAPMRSGVISIESKFKDSHFATSALIRVTKSQPYMS